jgi:hypothetical protein
MGKSSSLPPSGQYKANYGNFQTELYAQIRREAFWEDIGQNSWLTSDDQDRFLEWLALSLAKTLLDVACGAGGPALRLSAIPVALLLALTFTNRQLRRRVHLQPNSAWPSAPNFGLQMLLGRCHFLTPASTSSPVLTR